jgi:hypothetical protein
MSEWGPPGDEQVVMSSQREQVIWLASAGLTPIRGDD